MASDCTLSVKFFPLLSQLSGLVLVSAMTLGGGSSVQAQTAANQPADYRPLAQPSSILSIAGGDRLVQEASQGAAQKNYALAQQKLQDARQAFNQISNFYQDLSTNFVGINSPISDNLRKKALEAAQKRDAATFQLAVVHWNQNQPELAVPLLIQVVQSQNPTTDLGKQSYEQLLQLGFVDVPFPSANATPPSADRPLIKGSSILSLPGADRLVEEASASISQKNYGLAQQKLQDARQSFNQLSNFYGDLAAAFVGIDPKVSDPLQKRALEAAQKRDNATFQLALVHRANNKPELSVPLLAQIIQSQNPASSLGKQAYEQLLELGFVDIPFSK